MADPQSVLEVLRDARERVRTGWGVGRLDVPLEVAPGRSCASVAISDVLFARPVYDCYLAADAHNAILEAVGLPPTADESFAAVWRWNDSQPSRWPVVAAFDRAIETLEAQLAPEPTPNADALLEVLDACTRAGEVVARYIVTNCPQSDLREVTTLVATELFYAAQDTAQAVSLGVTVQR